jgi:hypothetical protein
MKYINSIDFIDYIIVGCNNFKQFRDNLLAFKERAFLKSQISIINKVIKVKNKRILDARNF